VDKFGLIKGLKIEHNVRLAPLAQIAKQIISTSFWRPTASNPKSPQ
jgi:hypothetical protein